MAVISASGRRHVSGFSFALLLVVVMSQWAFPAGARSLTDSDIPIAFSADELSIDHTLATVTARGRVEVNHRERTLFADTIFYDQNADVLTATGNITLLEPGGDVIFARRMEITGDLRDGVVSDIGVILSDSSLLAARDGSRSGDDLNLRNAVYSPCRLCKEDPERPPLWQIKAVRVVHDKSRKTVRYSDAWVELLGIPVLYTPYLSHPDPTVERESGLLAPQFGASSDLGFTAKVPYFQVINTQSDATITPVYYTKSGPALEVAYRHRFFDGEAHLNGSILTDDKKGIRGHFHADARFDLDRTWRWGFEATLVSDDNYLRQYNFPVPDDTLTTRPYIEGFRGQNYTRIEAIHFRGLQSDDNIDETPLVLPMASFHHVGQTDRFGGQFVLDADIVSLMRAKGTDSTRVSLHPGWQNRYISPGGGVYGLSLNLKGDLYYTKDQDVVGETTGLDGVAGRLFPQAKIDWRLPLVRQGRTIYQIVEPIVSVVLAPNGSNPPDIPNEDSLDPVFSEVSLFNANRFAGTDRVDSGSRVDYGLHWGLVGKNNGRTDILIGQSIRFRDSTAFAAGSGLENRVSDFVGRLSAAPTPYLNIDYRTQFNTSKALFRRNEVLAKIGIPAFSIRADYRQIDALGSNEFMGRKDISLGFSSQLSRTWHLSGSALHDLANGETRDFDLGLVYEDECFIVATSLNRSFFRDRDLTPTDTIMVRISLKTLGDFQASVF